MPNRSIFLLILLLLSTSHTSNATVYRRDLLSLGDGLLTYDDVNNKEWADLALSTGWNLSDMEEALMPSGPFSDFRVASISEIVKLASSSGVTWLPPEQLVSPPESDSPDRLIGLLGDTLDTGAQTKSQNPGSLIVSQGHVFDFFTAVYDLNANGVVDVGDQIYGTGVDLLLGRVIEFPPFSPITPEYLGLNATTGLASDEHNQPDKGLDSLALVSVFSLDVYPQGYQGNSESYASNGPGNLLEFHDIIQRRGGAFRILDQLGEPAVGPFWLVRDVVPEPSSINLLVTLMFAFFQRGILRASSSVASSSY